MDGEIMISNTSNASLRPPLAARRAARHGVTRKLAPLRANKMFPVSEQPQTAAIMEETSIDIELGDEPSSPFELPPRTYSQGAAASSSRDRGHHIRRPRSRQKNISGGEGGDSDQGSNTSSNLMLSTIFARGLTRTNTMVSHASSEIPTDEWRRLFERYDKEHNGRLDGQIPIKDFEKILEENLLWVEKVPPDIRADIIASADTNGDGVITEDEFIQLATGRNIPGFNRRRRRALRELLKQTVEFIVPIRYQYQNQYSCCPPPLFMLGISLAQIIIFAYNSAVGGIGLNGPVFFCSNLIFDPDKRVQVWRYLTYMLVHSGLFHAMFNILIQLILGIPLEMVHGWWRVMLVYLAGGIAGSLWTSVLKPDKFLSGASGGVYALITAHLGTVIMNFREMTCPLCRILLVAIVAVSDIGVYIYNVYIAPSDVTGAGVLPVGYTAHISGATAGLLVGIMGLKNLRWERHEKYIWAVSAFIFFVLISTAIIWSVAFPEHFPGVRGGQEIPCISNKIL